ncbi:MAG TPA: hypothetical protein VI217_08165 [Mycobacterium sp.]
MEALDDADCSPTSIDTPLSVGCAIGSDFGWTAGLLFAAGSPLLTTLSEGVGATARGFFGVTTVVDASEPDFLTLTVSDFLSVLLVSLPLDSSSPPAPSLSSPLASSSPADSGDSGLSEGD